MSTVTSAFFDEQVELIRLLGGNANCARLVNEIADYEAIDAGTVAMWKQEGRGISWTWRPTVAIALRRKKIQVPDWFLIPTPAQTKAKRTAAVRVPVPA